MRKTFKDDELKGWLEEKDTLVNEGRELSKEIEALEEKRNTCGMKIQKLKDKIIPRGEELIKDSLGEFDVLTTITIDGEEVALEYIDQVEDFKRAVRERKQKEEVNENTAG